MNKVNDTEEETEIDFEEVLKGQRGKGSSKFDRSHLFLYNTRSYS